MVDRANRKTVVFLSSTFVDLEEERAAVMDTLAQFDDLDCIAMEQFGARVESAFHLSLNCVDKADLFIGLVGHRWGSGITELEYRRAIASKKPCLFFLREEAVALSAPEEPRHSERLRVFREEIADAYYGHIVVRFRNALELRAQVSVAVSNWLRKTKPDWPEPADIKTRYLEIQNSIMQGRLTDGIVRLMDFTNDFAVDQRHKQEAIVMSFQLNQIQQRERNGELGAAQSIEIMTNQA
jgi:hypothetical protein